MTTYVHRSYDLPYYLDRAGEPTTDAYHAKRLRCDNLAAFSYALGLYDYETVVEVQGKERFDDQVMGIALRSTTSPRRVLDVGCGRGELCAAFSLIAIPVVGVDASSAAFDLSNKTVNEWGRSDYAHIVLQTFDEENWHDTDTIIMCESLEHINRAVFDLSWSSLVEHLRSQKGRLIITNHIELHPIYPDSSGWDHISVVDDARFDGLSRDAVSVLVRRGSHLVLQF